MGRAGRGPAGVRPGGTCGFSGLFQGWRLGAPAGQGARRGVRQCLPGDTALPAFLEGSCRLWMEETGRKSASEPPGVGAGGAASPHEHGGGPLLRLAFASALTGSGVLEGVGASLVSGRNPDIGLAPLAHIGRRPAEAAGTSPLCPVEMVMLQRAHSLGGRWLGSHLRTGPMARKRGENTEKDTRDRGPSGHLGCVPGRPHGSLVLGAASPRPSFGDSFCLFTQTAAPSHAPGTAHPQQGPGAAQPVDPGPAGLRGLQPFPRSRTCPCGRTCRPWPACRTLGPMEARRLDEAGARWPRAAATRDLPGHSDWCANMTEVRGSRGKAFRGTGHGPFRRIRGRLTKAPWSGGNALTACGPLVPAPARGVARRRLCDSARRRLARSAAEGGRLSRAWHPAGARDTPSCLRVRMRMAPAGQAMGGGGLTGAQWVPGTRGPVYVRFG